MPNRPEEIASKAMGTVKAAKATVTGLHGVFKQLTVEHGEVSALLMRLKMSSDPSVRRELFPTIRKQLLAHEDGELKNVYPIFKETAETARIAEHHASEASELRTQLDTLSATAVDSSSWQDEIERLVELVTHHVKEEESEYFPAGQRAFGDRADEMLKEYLRTKEQALTDLTTKMPD